MYDRGKMKKIIILIPVYNDWESLNKLLLEINNTIHGIEGASFECLIINDASSEPCPEIKLPSNISSLKIINMKKIKAMQDVMLLVSDFYLKMKNMIMLF